MNESSITQEYLKELFFYDGKNLIRRVSHGRGKAGDIAGTLSPRGYRKIQINGKICQAHRLIWVYVYGKCPSNEIDHINGIRYDNRIENLRDVTPCINQRNRPKAANNKSGVTGVAWHKASNMWQARVNIDGVQIYLGLFECRYRAASVRHLAMELHGGFTARHGA